jgi:hypothetical protein
MRKAILVCVAGIAVLFLGGLFQLFDLVFEKGDIYPAYSSFRSDPLGARALYEAMKSLGSISVSRNLKPLTRLPDGKNKTMFFFGSNLSEDPEDLIKALENFAAGGGRLVITFYPITAELVEYSESKEKDGKCSEGNCDPQKTDKKEKQNQEKEDGDKAEDEKDEEPHEPWFTQFVSIEKRWGFKFASLRPRTEKPQDHIEINAAKQNGPSELPQSLPWHSILYFSKLSAPWKVFYSWDGHAVVAERPWVRGNIVLCSDSYFLSNEAMRDERHPELIAWLVGSSTSAIFDETHFGLQQEEGVMTLARKYRLDRPLAALIVLGLLFVWKNTMSLVPKKSSSAEEARPQGKDSTAGLVNLLRRSVSPQKILPVCVDEWSRSVLRQSEAFAKKERIREVLDREMAKPARERNPIKAYQTISEILKERNGQSES